MALDSGNFTQGASAVFGVGRHSVGERCARYTPGVFKEILDMIPMGRLGETAEAAHFTVALLDGYNMYTTGNFFPIAGGFNNEGMKPF